MDNEKIQQVIKAVERKENILQKGVEILEETKNEHQLTHEVLKNKENMFQRVDETLEKLENASQQVQEKENRLQQLRETNNARPSNLNDAALQSKKRSKLPAIAASTLAIAGVAGVAIAAYLKMLAVGVVVGACCLVVAAVIYYCNIPSSSLESSNTINAAGEQLVIQKQS